MFIILPIQIPNMFFYFIRHAESYVNLTHEFSYKLIDKSLTPKGLEQAKQAARYLISMKSNPIQKIYSSPLLRAKETAEIIQKVLKKPMIIIEELRELNVGDLEKKPTSSESWELFYRIWNAWDDGNYDDAFPNGEDYHTLSLRMIKALDQIFKNEKKPNPNMGICIVSHGGIFSQILPLFVQNVNRQYIKERDWPNTAITTVSIEQVNQNFIGVMHDFCLIDHLQGNAAKLVNGTPK